MSTIHVPKGFSYVAASLLSTVFLTAWQSIVVGSARKSAAIPYPQLYAEKAEAEASKTAHIFNCKQRAHQNTLENIPGVIVTTLIAGLNYPIIAAAACGIWTSSRIIYTAGYATGDPKKRNRGSYGTLALLALLGVASKSAYDLVVAGI
ncbi:membrane-associated proteins in eicosanoid and glutathione metabolism [Dentipellis sp. KUC8613]|nr:membrane-associated proteins in eicosanoid and glutathione metabolism [Dentipellis sp. KUC8613]